MPLSTASIAQLSARYVDHRGLGIGVLRIWFPLSTPPSGVDIMDGPPEEAADGISFIDRNYRIVGLTELTIMWLKMINRTMGIALLAGVFASAALLSTNEIAAQDAVLSQLYGKGVHAFFEGDYEGAHGLLTEAVEGGTRDPRVYYFRAMAYHQLGRPDEAVDDMMLGARLEVADVNQFYPVSRSLERVQGRARVALEKYRRDARMERYQKANQRRRERFGGDGDLPTPKAGAPRKLPADSGDAAPVEEQGDGFKEEGDPFGDDPVAEEGGDDAADPFAEGDGTDGETPVGDDADADAANSPFGDDAAEGGDGFEEEADADSPFGDDDEGDEGFDDDTPFGDDDELAAESVRDDQPRVAAGEAGAEGFQGKLGKDGAKAIGRGIMSLFGGGSQGGGSQGPAPQGIAQAGDASMEEDFDDEDFDDDAFEE